MNHKVAILGAGSWGSAVALHLAHAGHHVSLWGHDQKQMKSIQKNRENRKYLPGISFPNNLTATSNIHHCIKDAYQVIIAVPSHAFKTVLLQIINDVNQIAWLTKGIDPDELKLLSEVVLAHQADMPYAVISGPSFAKEVAAYLPTAVVVASPNENFMSELVQLLHYKNFRVYKSLDPVGVQICGAVKNVLAIACGISDGLSFGANAKAALITRGLAEMSRLGIQLGAQAETFAGLAGTGDLVLTCTDDQSRNRRFGLLVGKGLSINEAEHQIQQVVEGKHNARLIHALAQKHHVSMPICEVVNDVLTNQMSAEDAVKCLLNRPPTIE